jgi:hypothetical protein
MKTARKILESGKGLELLLKPKNLESKRLTILSCRVLWLYHLTTDLSLRTRKDRWWDRAEDLRLLQESTEMVCTPMALTWYKTPILITLDLAITAQGRRQVKSLKPATMLPTTIRRISWDCRVKLEVRSWLMVFQQEGFIRDQDRHRMCTLISKWTRQVKTTKWGGVWRGSFRLRIWMHEDKSKINLLVLSQGLIKLV